MKKNSEIFQLKKPYYSTIQFEKFLLKHKILQNKNVNNVLDVGCGLGANIQYFSKKYPNINFTGWDYSKKLITQARKINQNLKNIFNIQDIYKIRSNNNYNFDLIFSVHTFCVFKEIEEPIRRLSKIKSKWLAINSLFYDAPLDVLIHIRDLKDKTITDSNPNADFNIHSLSNTFKILRKYNYTLIDYINFYPEKKIKRKNLGRGSYTIKTEFNKNTIFSGPVHLPWYFILAKKND
jgi:SAM-dependent methyltransferase